MIHSYEVQGPVVTEEGGGAERGEARGSENVLYLYLPHGYMGVHRMQKFIELYT